MTAASAAGTGGTYGLPYMTGSPTELTASPQQLWNAQGKCFVFICVLRPHLVLRECQGEKDDRSIIRTTQA